MKNHAPIVIREQYRDGEETAIVAEPTVIEYYSTKYIIGYSEGQIVLHKKDELGTYSIWFDKTTTHLDLVNYMLDICIDLMSIDTEAYFEAYPDKLPVKSVECNTGLILGGFSRAKLVFVDVYDTTLDYNAEVMQLTMPFTKSTLDVLVALREYFKYID